MSRPEDYQDAIQVLNCAHGHDPTDRTVHRALAERHYMKAAQMWSRRNHALALEATRSALKFDPKHEHARRLFEKLMEAGPDKPPG